MSDQTALPITGGCQCGAVRYEANAAPIRPSLCHCRMCQKAYGNVFGALVSFPAENFRFVSGKPKDYRSSKIAIRGFCESCGTPLTFIYDAEPEQIAEAAHRGGSGVSGWGLTADLIRSTFHHGRAPARS
jgi:hypothetical protein